MTWPAQCILYSAFQVCSTEFTCHITELTDSNDSDIGLVLDVCDGCGTWVDLNDIYRLPIEYFDYVDVMAV